MKVGRPPDYVIAVLSNRFGVPADTIRKLACSLQLARCPSNEAIRLILGVSK